MSKKKSKKKPQVLSSDQDILDAFQEEKSSSPREVSRGGHPRVNKHGVKVIDAIHFSEEDAREPDLEEGGEEEDFKTLLDQSFSRPRKKLKAQAKPLPLAKRLKRYPPPEADLDLHGFSALGAELKARSFIASCHQQGYFTLRIIVGKGLHSQEGPVLPDVMEDLLKNMKRENLVLSYEWDRKRKAKSGSLIVYLKRFND